MRELLLDTSLVFLWWTN